MVLFERDMNRAERARYNGRAALVEWQPGPLAPFGDRSSHDHAAWRDFDDLGPGADMDAHPSVERQAVGSAAQVSSTLSPRGTDKPPSV